MRISDWSSDVCSSDLFLAERLATLPLLLDELLDARVAGPLPERDDFAPQCAQALAHEDTEAALMVLNETRQALSFRIALSTEERRGGKEWGSKCRSPWSPHTIKKKPINTASTS